MKVDQRLILFSIYEFMTPVLLDRERKEKKREGERKGEKREKGKNLPVGDRLAINHEFLVVYKGGQSAPLL